MTHYMEALRKKMLEVSNGEWRILDEKKDDTEHTITVEYVPKVLPFSLRVKAVYFCSEDKCTEWDKWYYSDVQIGDTKIRVRAPSLEMLFRKLQQLFEIVEHAEVVK